MSLIWVSCRREKKIKLVPVIPIHPTQDMTDIDFTNTQNGPTLEKDKEEYLLKPELKRFILLPIQHHDIWRMYQQAESAFWVASEVNLTQDIIDWDTKLNADEKHFISYVLAFFAGSDGLVTENLVTRFGAEVCFSRSAAVLYVSRYD